MNRPAIACLLLSLPVLGIAVAPAQTPHDATAKLLKSVEDHYNKTQSVKLEFSETYAGMHRPVQTESGVLFLRKPGRMRWDYAQPAGKVFISDGKDVFFYTPGEAQAQKSKLKQSEDMHAPIAFLLGRLDFSKEFRSFELRPDGAKSGDTWIAAVAKTDNVPYTSVEFLAAPDGMIKRVRVTGQDQSKLDFTFTNEQRNVPVAEALFFFHAPPGIPIVEVAP